jgi:hypothetical protein
MRKPKARRKPEWEEALYADLLANGPILLWAGDGTIPGNFRGLVPRTLGAYLKGAAR